MSQTDRQVAIIQACMLFGIPGDRETAYALADVAALVHAKLDGVLDADDVPNGDL